MAMIIHDCIQGEEPWFRARMGIPTCSEFATVMAKGEGKTRKTYMLKLAGEIVTGEPMESYSNANMERGKVMEAEARDLYSMLTDADLTRIGFVTNGPKGCSPDSFIGNDGMLEIKTSFPHILIPLLLNNEFPPEYRAQCQGGLWVCEREWIDIGVYWPKMPLFKVRAHRDNGYIANLAGEVDRFNDELAETVSRVKSYRAAA